MHNINLILSKVLQEHNSLGSAALRMVQLQTVTGTNLVGGQIGKTDLSAGDFQMPLSMGLEVQVKNA